MADLEAHRLLLGETSRDSVSHLRAVTPTTKGIDAFVPGTRKESTPMVPLLKE